MQDVSIIEEGQGFALESGGKQLLTPAKQKLVLPTRALAEAVAREWAQAKGKFSPDRMMMTALSYTAIDRIAPAHAIMVEALCEYARTDTLCYRSPEPELAARQEDEWNPWIDWMKARFQCRLQTTQDIFAQPQDEADINLLAAYLNGLDSFQLAAFGVLAPIFGSLILTLAVNEGVTDAGQAYKVSALEARFQAERWGEDEEAAQGRTRSLQEVTSAEQFLRFVNEIPPRRH